MTARQKLARRMPSTQRVALLRFQLQVERLKLKIGGAIRELREERKASDPKWTQDYLARLIDPKITGTQVSRWERGEVRPGDDRLQRIAEIFEVDVSDLMMGPRNGNEPRPKGSVGDLFQRIKDLEEDPNAKTGTVLAEVVEMLGAVHRELAELRDEVRVYEQVVGPTTEPDRDVDVLDEEARKALKDLDQRGADEDQPGPDEETGAGP